MGTRVRELIMTLPPAAFAFVMAAGIVAVGLDLVGLAAASWVLIGVAGVGYLALVVMTVVRLLRWRHLLVGDLRDPARSFGFFTFVAGTDVLGVALAEHGAYRAALVLLLIGLVAGVILGYVVPWLAALGGGPPPLRVVDGTWFVWVVAAQSVAVLAAMLSPVFPGWTYELATVSVMGWSAGAVLYLAVAALVLVRLTGQPVGPADMNQSYWITMGAMAVTIVGGSLIVGLDPGSSPMVTASQQLISGVSVIMWCFATALIPLLVAVGFWRHIVHGIPLHYKAAQWSIVFPLGMYAVAGMQLGRADDLPMVAAIGRGWIWVAVGAWLLTFVAMLVAVFARRRPAGVSALPSAG
ncbi:tellurite resistance/C4-dicarboxylate transporter family protein [Corynebacterium halotolerans]|uniref:C4-dicarboxylate transporter/malic acid transport protein n=1 Tax=Corynebacterium halotolerans YIM 70093 = DSM 44683 TaxID=1121362 RepID=M1P5Z0_9CORY|nr:tellurite resistance/C4-dicarboxylate transporter family protein [Corynebacterium halotolerans]AGF72051.1 C4-dicarboxylate transporter/malic acid transport protein [Corynebacterium halotolerans YIM 70093 = DSM 44683]